MKTQYNIGDLFKALAKDESVSKNILRLFTYMFAKIMEENTDDLGKGIPTDFSYISSSENITHSLNINLSEYHEAKKFLLEHHLLICQENEGVEIWFPENSNRWFLKTLGPNLIDVEKIEDPKIVMNDVAHERIFDKPFPK